MSSKVPRWFETLVPVTLERMAESVEGDVLDPLDAEPYTEVDIEEIRSFWAEANPDADGMLDARPWTGAVAGE